MLAFHYQQIPLKWLLSVSSAFNVCSNTFRDVCRDWSVFYIARDFCGIIWHCFSENEGFIFLKMVMSYDTVELFSQLKDITGYDYLEASVHCKCCYEFLISGKFRSIRDLWTPKWVSSALSQLMNQNVMYRFLEVLPLSSE